MSNNIKIGSFTTDKDGALHGKLYGLGFSTTSVLFLPKTSKSGKTYFKIIADPAKEAYEVGIAFPKDKHGMPYYNVNIDSPVFPQPINAALFPDEVRGNFNLIWARKTQEQTPKAKADYSQKCQSLGQAPYHGPTF